MFPRRPRALLTLLLLAAAPLAAQEPEVKPPPSQDSLREAARQSSLARLGADSASPRPDGVRAGAQGRPGAVRALPWLGGIGEERQRLAELGGEAPASNLLLRSLSTRGERGAGTAYAALLAPRLLVVQNSRIPHSQNDGALWAGRGLGVSLLAGVEVAVGPLRLILAPEVVYEQNQAFDGLLPAAWDSTQRATFLAPWTVGEHSADLPYRMGGAERTRVFAGESSLTLRLGPLEVGAAHEAQWWGPGVRNAIVLSNHAGGFPHALARTSRPLRTPLGQVEGRWLAGRLSPSPFDTTAGAGQRSLSAVGLLLTPAAGVSLGVARVVWARSAGRGTAAGAADAWLRWRGAGDSLTAHPFDQITALFARWVLPADGAEVYAEWARRSLPASLGDFLEQPEHTQGYTLGAQWARPALAGRLRLAAEVTYLEKSPTYRLRPTGSFYAGRAVPQGYTHRGQVLGAAIGPGSSSQWAAVDWIGRRAQAGLSLTRIRWANDAFYTTPNNARYRGHDVSLLGGARAGVAVGAVWLDVEWSAGHRHNFLFQSRATNWDNRDLTVSPFNHTLRLGLSAAPPR